LGENKEEHLAGREGITVEGRKYLWSFGGLGRIVGWSGSMQKGEYVVVREMVCRVSTYTPTCRPD